MKRVRHWYSTFLALIVWCMTSGLSPLVALHLAFDHDQHAAHEPYSHGHEASDQASTEHDGSNHEHQQIDVGLAQTVVRLGVVAPSAAMAVDSWHCGFVLPDQCCVQRTDVPPRSSPSLLRSCILLL